MFALKVILLVLCSQLTFVHSNQYLQTVGEAIQPTSAAPNHFRQVLLYQCTADFYEGSRDSRTVKQDSRIGHQFFETPARIYQCVSRSIIQIYFAIINFVRNAIKAIIRCVMNLAMNLVLATIWFVFSPLIKRIFFFQIMDVGVSCLQNFLTNTMEIYFEVFYNYIGTRFKTWPQLLFTKVKSVHLTRSRKSVDFISFIMFPTNLLLSNAPCHSVDIRQYSALFKIAQTQWTRIPSLLRYAFTVVTIASIHKNTAYYNSAETMVLMYTSIVFSARCTLPLILAAPLLWLGCRVILSTTNITCQTSVARSKWCEHMLSFVCMLLHMILVMLQIPRIMLLIHYTSIGSFITFLWVWVMNGDILTDFFSENNPGVPKLFQFICWWHPFVFEFLVNIHQLKICLKQLTKILERNFRGVVKSRARSNSRLLLNTSITETTIMRDATSGEATNWESRTETRYPEASEDCEQREIAVLNHSNVTCHEIIDDDPESVHHGCISSFPTKWITLSSRTRKASTRARSQIPGQEEQRGSDEPAASLGGDSYSENLDISTNQHDQSSSRLSVIQQHVEGISALPDLCCVCNSPMSIENELIIRLSCGHTFHSCCILKFMCLNGRCPFDQRIQWPPSMTFSDAFQFRIF